MNCDGGPAAGVGKWIHLVATFDGKQARVFQDGKQVASKECDSNRAPSLEPLCVGQYGASLTEPYQVHGQITGVKLYRRVIGDEEAAAMARMAAPGQ